MGFIDHEEVESIPQPVHVPVRALEGGYRHRRKVAEAISKASDLVGVDGANLSEPLLKENPSRYQAKRAQSGLRHRRQGDARLSAPGRQNDEPSPPAQLPGAESCFLIRPQSDGRPVARRCEETARVLRSRRVQEWNPVPEWDPSSTEILHHFDVPTSGRSICLYTGIPEEAAHIGEVDVLRRVRNQHGAAIEHEPHGRRAPATRMPSCAVGVLRGTGACTAWLPATCTTFRAVGLRGGRRFELMIHLRRPVRRGSDGITASRPRSSVGLGIRAASGAHNGAAAFSAGSPTKKGQSVPASVHRKTADQDPISTPKPTRAKHGLRYSSDRSVERTCLILVTCWCPGAESNHRHGDFQSPALPTELPGPAGARLYAARERAGQGLRPDRPLNQDFGLL